MLGGVSYIRGRGGGFSSAKGGGWSLVNCARTLQDIITVKLSGSHWFMLTCTGGGAHASNEPGGGQGSKGPRVNFLPVSLNFLSYVELFL